MAEVRPELVFLTGPQAGKRTVLTSNVMIAGRSVTADINLTELHASRQQARFEFAADGWMMGNLSHNGTRVNGKRYKSCKKKVLLGTGDVLEVGLETRILFVSAGDDPEQAVAAYRREHGAPQGAVHPPAVEGEQGKLPSKGSAARTEPAKPEAPSAASPQLSPEDMARKAKMRKYAIFGIVWVAFLIALVILLSRMSKKEEPTTTRVPALSKGEISELLSEVPKKNLIPARAAEELRKARSLYDNLPSKPGDLYRCVRSFHLYLAYKRDRGFENARDEKNYEKARGELIGLVQQKYKDSWANEQAGYWADAENAFQELTRIVPEKERGNPVYDRLMQNIVKHLRYVRSKMRKRRR